MLESTTRIAVSALFVAAMWTVGGTRSYAAPLEEILVTAQKRVQSLQDVPIAINAVRGDEMRDGAIDKLENLAPSIPTFALQEGFGLDGMFIRGIGSGINFGFEQAVGLVLDGFVYGRSRFGRAQFLDIERVEVLKGPQGALIGKNTTAGAINITTNKPNQEFEAWATAGLHVDGTEGYTAEGAISGGVTEAVSARLAVIHENLDGFFDNYETGDDDQNVEDTIARLSVLIEPTDSLSMLLSGTLGDLDRQGRTLENRLCSANYLGFLAANGVSEPNCREDYRRNADNKRNGIPDESNETDFSIFNLTLDWAFEAFTLTSLTGFAEYDYLEKGDNDRSPVENISSDLGEDYEQFSQELRLVSEVGGRYDWILGGYFQHTEQDTLFNLHVDANPLGAPLALNRHIVTDQESDIYSVFGQLNWHLSDSWTLTFDGRYTREEKEAEQTQFPTEIYNDAVQIPGPGTGGPAGAFNEHMVIGDRTENDFSPGVTVQWSPNDDSMYYVSAKKGFKGGGFDHNLSAGTDLPQSEIEDLFEFEEEEVLAFELGGKLVLADGAANLNFALFRSEFDDLQVSTLTGPGTFNVGNAASAITQGLEVDAKWQVTDNLRLSLAGALLDGEYDDYPDAPCSEFQKGNNPSGIVTCPDPVTGTQDLSDKTLQYSPDWSYALAAEYIQPIANLELIGAVQLYGQDDSALALDLDPNTFQDAYHKLDARVTLQREDGRWAVSLVGRNLTDKRTANWANDFPVFVGSYWSILEPPRVITLQGTLRF
jgi:outer membrane receptor protein involved in Fe transport